MIAKLNKLLLWQHSRHAYGTSVLCATLAAFLCLHDKKRSKQCHMHSLLWMVCIKYPSQKGMFFAKIRRTTPAAPLLQAYQGGFFFLVPKQLMLNADSLRWLSSPKPRLVLPSMGGKLGSYPICRELQQDSVIRNLRITAPTANTIPTSHVEYIGDNHV